MASRLFLVVLMLCALAITISTTASNSGCSSSSFLTFASAAAIPNRNNVPQLSSSDAASASSFDSLGLAILREYKALGEHHHQPHYHHANNILADPYPPTYPLGFPSVTLRELQSMTNRELRTYISDRGGRCDGCVEKVHLLERAIALRGVPTQNEAIVSMLTPFSTAAPSHIGTSADLVRPQSQGEVAMNHQAALSHALLKDPRYICEVVGHSNPASTSEDAGIPQGELGMMGSTGSGRKNAAAFPNRPPEITCRPRTAEDAEYA